jgi:hypothetical protein
MTTKKQAAANRRNAKKSTGPKTPEGKARSAQNRITHGLLSRQVLLREEDPDRFREVCGQLWTELRPLGELETYLAARIVSGIWRMNRVVRIEAQLFNEAPLRAVDPDVGIGKLFRLDCAHGGSPFSRLHRYETAIDLGIQRAWRTLRAAQAERRREEAAEESERREREEREFRYEAIRTRGQAGGGSVAERGTPAPATPRRARGRLSHPRGEVPEGRSGMPSRHPRPAASDGGNGKFPLEAILAQAQAGSGMAAKGETAKTPGPAGGSAGRRSG